MQPISLFTYQQSYPQSTKTERGELLKYFTGVINKERIGTKWKPVTIRGVAVTLSHLSLKDLYYMQSVCKDKEYRGESCGKYIYGSIKVR